MGLFEVFSMTHVRLFVLTVNIISQLIDCMYVTNVYNRHCLQPLEVDFHFRTKIISNLYKTDMTM